MDISDWVEQLAGELKEDAFEISNKLAEIGGDEVIDSMVNLLENSNMESRIIAARTLGLIRNNSRALKYILDAVTNKDNETIAGDLMMSLESFDLSDCYVDIFKCYLFGSFKVSMQAKELMDHKEFDITPRVLKKVKKHWNHYTNNIKHDELFNLTKVEVDDIIEGLEVYISSS